VQKHPTVSKAAPYRSLSAGEFEHLTDNMEAFREGVEWIRNYLARPHPELGRQGTVCPFAQPALDDDTIRLAVVRLSGGNKRTQILDAVEYHLKAFLLTGSPGEQQMLHATLILFPDVSPEEAPDLIDRTKEDLKSSFVQRGLMLGEFHQRNNSPGLHNANFRPLRSPIPMLAIRRMVSTDFMFLNRSEYDAPTRLRYLDAYLSAPGIPEHARKEGARAAASLRAELHG
jgi:uncharacterized protein DUF6875